MCKDGEVMERKQRRREARCSDEDHTLKVPGDDGEARCAKEKEDVGVDETRSTERKPSSTVPTDGN